MVRAAKPRWLDLIEFVLIAAFIAVILLWITGCTGSLADRADGAAQATTRAAADEFVNSVADEIPGGKLVLLLLAGAASAWIAHRKTAGKPMLPSLGAKPKP